MFVAILVARLKRLCNDHDRLEAVVAVLVVARRKYLGLVRVAAAVALVVVAGRMAMDTFVSRSSSSSLSSWAEDMENT